MRHRAAVGLSEETDAVVIVVSEETGQISAAYNGRLHRYDDEKVDKVILRWFRVAMPYSVGRVSTITDWFTAHVSKLVRRRTDKKAGGGSHAHR